MKKQMIKALKLSFQDFYQNMIRGKMMSWFSSATQPIYRYIITLLHKKVNEMKIVF